MAFLYMYAKTRHQKLFLMNNLNQIKEFASVNNFFFNYVE